jgi:hypothetical protein
MARSTIQEKLSGKSSPNLHQVLSLVTALAEYGQKHGTPLTPQEVDENSWRAKFVASQGKSNQTPEKLAREFGGSGLRVWNSEPLRHAGMTDLLDLIERSQEAPPATWLPHVASEMFHAHMSCEGLIKWAAEGSAQDVVQCIAGLDQIFPVPPPSEDPWGSSWSPGNSATVRKLLLYAARFHGAQSSPVIIVGLRRSDCGEYVNDFLSNVACWHLPHDLHSAVNGLKSAELTRDSMQLLEYVGSRRLGDRIMEVVQYLDHHGLTVERNKVLEGMASHKERFMIGVRGTMHDEMQEDLIEAVPLSNRPEFAARLNAAGLEELAEKVLAPRPDDPPF